MSLLPELIPLGGIVLAFNIAYLRLDQFRHRDRVREYAQRKLGEISDKRVVPASAGKSENYRALANLAENPKGKTRDFPKAWSRAYAILLRSRFDRKVALALAGVGLAVMCMGSAHATNQWQWQWLVRLFMQERISWSLWILVGCSILSVLFVILGERVVAGTFENIDKYAKESMHLMQEKAAQVRMRDPDDVLASNATRIQTSRPR